MPSELKGMNRYKLSQKKSPALSGRPFIPPKAESFLQEVYCLKTNTTSEQLEQQLCQQLELQLCQLEQQ